MNLIVKKKQKNRSRTKILIFSDSILSRIKTYDFNKALKKWESQHLPFPETCNFENVHS